MKDTEAFPGRAILWGLGGGGESMAEKSMLCWARSSLSREGCLYPFPLFLYFHLLFLCFLLKALDAVSPQLLCADGALSHPRISGFIPGIPKLDPPAVLGTTIPIIPDHWSC
ncbi:Hypothetical predicted protein [Podarcis lilfordi]|uniref:Uncharacterized protein n=1 Tax=Podarcis lilfordi TaxID=74358 RepID=A0AA35P4V0_9SAUR|nr:Hypothetical predicted protein [Podarcis lilfordi]